MQREQASTDAFVRKAVNKESSKVLHVLTAPCCLLSIQLQFPNLKVYFLFLCKNRNFHIEKRKQNNWVE